MQPFHPLRILIAEDNPVNQRLVQAIFEHRGHLTVVAATGREALVAWERESFDIVLMDVRMPEMDGFEAAAAIRARETHRIPIIALTASAQDGDRERYLAAGIDTCVAKPIRSEELIELVESMASGREPSVRRLQPEVPVRDGDARLGKKLTGLFVADAARLSDEIRDAIARRDGAALQAAAHCLRGSAGHFAAHRACELAARLEELGRSGDFTAATDRASQELTEELVRLEKALSEGQP
jgi:two-component system, sensor histidine kinase and response regulator